MKSKNKLLEKIYQILLLFKTIQKYLTTHTDTLLTVVYIRGLLVAICTFHKTYPEGKHLHIFFIYTGNIYILIE